MLLRWYYSLSIVFGYLILNFIDAQHHSIYIPNYLQAFDYPSADETASSSQQDQVDYRANEILDPFQWDWTQTTTVPPNPYPFDTSMLSNETATTTTTTIITENTSTPIVSSTTPIITTTATITTETDSTVITETISSTAPITSIESSTTEQTTQESSSSTSTLTTIDTTITLKHEETSTVKDDLVFSMSDEIITKTNFDTTVMTSTSVISSDIPLTTEPVFNENSTVRTFSKNESEMILNLLNRTRFQSKNLMADSSFDILNTTAEEAARHLHDRKTMQSLIHLLPPSFWSQLQTNFSMNPNNQNPPSTKPPLSEPVHLNELPGQVSPLGPGPSYPVPDYMWHPNVNYHRNPPPLFISNSIPIINSPLTTSPKPKLIATPPIRLVSPNFPFRIPQTHSPFINKLYATKETSTLRPPIPRTHDMRPGSFIPVKQVPPPKPNTPENHHIQSLLAQIGFTCPSGVTGIRFPDQRLCNMYFTCTQTGLPEPSLCPDGYLFSEISRDCEIASHVNCGSRVSAFFDIDNANNYNGNGGRVSTTTTTIPTTTTTTSTTTTTTTTATTTTTSIKTTTTSTSTTTTTTTSSSTTTTTTTTTSTTTTTTTSTTTRTSTTTSSPSSTSTIKITSATTIGNRRHPTFPPSGRSQPNIVNGTVECVLGADGYFEDPLYCNVYHHCLAGIDYIEHCPNQLAWNEKKKMCDWTTNVNCTGKTMPVVQGKTSFCTNRQDGRYASESYCNAFHHCIGGTDHIVRCTGELLWDDKKKECGWQSTIHCGPPKKMLPNENKFNSTFCSGKTDGSYPHEEYCNVYHVCESGADNMRQCPHQLFWDNEQQKCEWSNNVRCSGRTLVALSMESSLFCMEKTDGFYIDPYYCNVYHQCLADIDVKLRCPERLIFNETIKRCDWPETTTCKSGNILLEGEDNNGFCTDKPNGNFAHEQYCNRYYICQNGKDVVFTCQNNLRYSVEKNECDWAVNVDCKGKPDYMWEGIKENFCKRLPDGNYPDVRFCNIFHQCQAAMDYPKRCPNRLMFNEDTKECDWEDKVDCKGREKLIDTEGLEDEVRPGTNNTRGRTTKFCMLKQNGDYADSYYCNVYHNCHGGFDTIQYCSRGLVWRQQTETIGRCDWSKERSPDGADCHGKALFFAEKLAENDILSNLRSEFCISKGAGLFEHQRYCDLYLQCNEQGVGVTMECSPGLVFNEKKKECDYQADNNDDGKGTLCLTPRSFLRAKPKAEHASILFEGVDATGQFPTRFDCINKDQQNMFADLDWCNIYHVCIGNRDNIFLCPPGTIFNDTKQGCMDRFDGNNCNGTRSYYKPQFKREKRVETPPISRSPPPSIPLPLSRPNFHLNDFQRPPMIDRSESIPPEWRKWQRSREFDENQYDWQRYRHHE